MDYVQVKEFQVQYVQANTYNNYLFTDPFKSTSSQTYFNIMLSDTYQVNSTVAQLNNTNYGFNGTSYFLSERLS